MELTYQVVSSGQELDRATLDGDQVSYATGAAQPVLESLTRRSGLTTAVLFAELARDGWTNGYVRIQPA